MIAHASAIVFDIGVLVCSTTRAEPLEAVSEVVPPQAGAAKSRFRRVQDHGPRVQLDKIAI